MTFTAGLISVILLAVTPGAMEMQQTKANVESAVRHLSAEIGPRSYLDTKELAAAAEYIEEKFTSFGLGVTRQPYEFRGNTYHNVIAIVPGTGDEDKVLVVGAHYDTVAGTPGADDNASGVAGLLELARLGAKEPARRTVHYAAFTLEEPPAFRTKSMGSYVYAKSLYKDGVKVAGMVSLEMIGYYSTRRGSQLYPLPLLKWIYPREGNFISFISNVSSKRFMTAFVRAFRAASGFPAETISTLSLIPGVDFSDHRNFWKFGFPAFMATDTSFYRNPHYHRTTDTADTLDYERTAEFVLGFHKALAKL